MSRCFVEQSLNESVPQYQAVNICLDTEQSTETLPEASNKKRLKDAAKEVLWQSTMFLEKESEHSK